jgi:hypothetical protein
MAKHVGNARFLRSPPMDVVLIRWPLEQDRRSDLAREGRPRLLLVEGSVPAPVPADCLEDWVRLPVDEADLRARVETLANRVRAHRTDVPELDRDGVLRFAGGWVSLPPVEGRLMEALIERFGAVVSRDQLARAGWPSGAPGRNALDVHVLRLRRRIDRIGLAIRTVRSRGYLLEPAGAGREVGGRALTQESENVQESA